MATGIDRSGSGVRPCVACEKKSAQWYCSADDAHLCNACDAQVHTANAVASRHQRVSLETKTSAVRFPGAPLACWSSSWLRKRSRSRRRHGSSNSGGQEQLVSTPTTDVPEDNPNEEDAPLSWLWSSDDVDAPLSWLCNPRVKSQPSEDVEYVKAEFEPEGLLDLNFDFSLVNERQKEEMKVHEERKFILQLDYEEVLSAWSDRSSPWSQAQPLMFPLEDTTSDQAGDGNGLDFGLVPELGCGQSSREHVIGQVPVMIDGGDGQTGRVGGREARVMRYREKRQSRLFYKNIRYHVRNLNAENRPRMKGRFVKRTADDHL